jgi:glycolate oxidase subunit GlcD
LGKAAAARRRRLHPPAACNAAAVTQAVRTIERELAALLGDEQVLPGDTAAYLVDATGRRGVRGHAEAVVLPRAAEEVAAAVAWCYERGVAIVPRGGGTGLAGGCVPAGGVVLATERLARLRSFDPLLWRMEAEAGVRTADVRRRARESGLVFPPDPGAGEQSQLGGNIATNAGGPHAFKYGVTGHWVTGVEAVVAPGELVRAGGPVRKDVAGYDLRGLLAGSEGTLGIVTSAWLRLLPAPAAVHPVAAFYADADAGCAAIEAVVGSGIVPAALEYLDGGTLAIAGPAYPGDVPAGARFAVLAEADGSEQEAARVRDELLEALGDGAIAVQAPDPAPLWRWRDGVSLAVAGHRGGKVSEDVAVPLDRLGDAIRGTLEIGARHRLQALSWGHAGDGNLHSSFLVAPGDEAELERAERAAGELFELALALGGTVSGEHGLGTLKRGHAGLAPRVDELQRAIKAAFDPKGLLNPGKKL